MAVNVASILYQQALQHPGRIALVDYGQPASAPRSASCGALDEGARRIGAYLRQRGLQPGQRVGLLSRNCLELVEAWFGITYAGGVVVPLPVASAPGEIAQRVRHARCGFLIHGAEQTQRVNEACQLAPEAMPERLQVEGLSTLSAAPLAAPVDRAASDAAMVLYTSGTLGQSKGASISHRSLIEHTGALVEHTLRLTAQDVVLGVLPIAHSYGIRTVVLASLRAGARCVLLPRFDAERSLQVLAEAEVSWLPAVPTMYAAWAAVPGAPDLPRLRWCLSAGAPLPGDIMERAERRLGVEIRQGYGMTEATFATMNAPPEPRVVGSVGRPVRGVELRIVDRQGHDLPPGQDGEVWVRGPNVMLGYLDDPQSTAEVLHEGWVRSGDIGHLDAEGRLFVVDRLKDMIIRGGHNIYPAEVENVLCSHPAVAEAAVIGCPDAYYGERVVAVIVPEPDMPLVGRQLLDWAASRLARHKLPQAVAIASELPQGASGKVHKRTLRAWLEDGSLEPTPTEQLRHP